MAKASRRNQSDTKTVKPEKGTVVKTTTKEGAAAATVTDPVKESEQIDHVVTKADLTANPELAELNVKEGETIQLPLQPNDENGEMLQEGEMPEGLKDEPITNEQLGIKQDEIPPHTHALSTTAIVTTSTDGETKTTTVETAAENTDEDEFEIVGIKAKKIKANDKEFVKHMQPYVKSYPREKCFYVTTDKQVFLSGNKIESVEHQRALDKSGTLIVFEL